MSDPRDDRDRSDGPDGPNDRRGGRDRSEGRDEDDLEERIADLEARTRELRTEMTRPPEGPLGLPRPPTPREVLSFTGEYAIPTAIAVLEANIRALKTLQRVVHVLDPEHSVATEGRDQIQSRAADASRATLDRLDDALSEVETAIREGDLPREPESRDLLKEIRRINGDVRERVDRSREQVDEARTRGRDADRKSVDPDGERGPERDGFDERGTTIEVNDPTETDDGDESAADRPQVDVEAELRSIKDEIEERNRPQSTPDGSADVDDDSAIADDEPDGGSDEQETNGDDPTASDDPDASATDDGDSSARPDGNDSDDEN